MTEYFAEPPRLGEVTAIRDRAKAHETDYHVGCVMLNADEEIIAEGFNVEVTGANGWCAERTAIFQALYLEVIDQATQMVVIGDDLYANPCGACRQAIRDYVNENCLVWWNTESGWTNLPAAELMKGR